VLVYRCAPARSRVPWAWWARHATPAGLASVASAPVTPPHQLRDGLARETHSVCAGHERAASARDRSYTISQSKRYCR